MAIKDSTSLDGGSPGHRVEPGLGSLLGRRLAVVELLMLLCFSFSHIVA